MTVRQDYLIKPLLNIYTEIYSESSDSESVQEKDPDSVQVQGDSDVESKVQNIGKCYNNIIYVTSSLLHVLHKINV